MIDTKNPITANYKVACGWNFLINFVEPISNDNFIIHGLIFDKRGFKIEVSWDKDGYPLMMNKYPTYYYMRLIKK